MYQMMWMAVLFVDRVSKWYMLQRGAASIEVNEYLSFHLVYNRGISWGMFNYDNPLIFFVITTLIICVIAALYVYTLQELQHGRSVFGPMLVLAGASSNVIDRLVYGAVVDFIVLSWGDWSWPAFNCADCAIVIGICIMLFTANDQ
jgi:signal peptidase II